MGKKEDIAYLSDMNNVATMSPDAVKGNLPVFGPDNKLLDSGKSPSDYIGQEEVDKAVATATSELWSVVNNAYVIAAYQSPKWTANTHYSVGEFCQSADNGYRCKIDHVSGTTFNPDYWKLILTSDGKAAIDTLLEAYSKDGLAALRDIAPAYDGSKSYKFGMLVIKDGVLQICTKDGRGPLAEFSSDATVEKSIYNRVSVVNGYYKDGVFYDDDKFSKLIEPKEHVIYIDILTNFQYRWDGVHYLVLSAPLTVDDHFDLESKNPVENRIVAKTIADEIERATNAEKAIETAAEKKYLKLDSSTEQQVNSSIGMSGILRVGSLNVDATGEAADYDRLLNKPRINSVELTGDKSAADLSLASAQSLKALDAKIDAKRDKNDYKIYRKVKDCWTWTNWDNPEEPDSRKAPEDFLADANSPNSEPIYFLNGAWWGAVQYWPSGKVKYSQANIPPAGIGEFSTTLNFAMFAYDETGKEIFRFGATATRKDPKDETLVCWDDNNQFIRIATTETVHNSEVKIGLAISNKVDKEKDKGLSSNDYTDDDKDKLDNIENGAQVNVIKESTSESGLNEVVKIKVVLALPETKDPNTLYLVAE